MITYSSVIKKEMFFTLTLSTEDLVSIMGVFMGEAAVATGWAPVGPSPLPCRKKRNLNRFTST